MEKQDLLVSMTINHEFRGKALLNTKKPSDGFLEGSDWAGLNHAQLQL